MEELIGETGVLLIFKGTGTVNYIKVVFLRLFRSAFYFNLRGCFRAEDNEKEHAGIRKSFQVKAKVQNIR